MRKLALVLALVPALAASPARAANPPAGFPAACPTYGDVRICSAEVPSFDGTKLDADLTLPNDGSIGSNGSNGSNASNGSQQDADLNRPSDGGGSDGSQPDSDVNRPSDGGSSDASKRDADPNRPNGGGARHPLIVMLHGFSNSKHEWESKNDAADGGDKWHWNNHWFATHGFYVLTYTARGFRDDGPSAPYEPATPSFTSADWPVDPYATIHLKSREFEIRDTQWLAALAARAFTGLDPNRVAVTGGSYGGGESWLQAAGPTWDYPHQLVPALPVLRLQAAVPKYPWTDLAYSLAPNGHGGGPQLNDIYESSQGLPSNPEVDDNPFGVPKQGYETAFFALGSTKGVFTHGEVAPYSQEESPPPAGDGPVSNDAWFTRGAADPYLAMDPIVRQIRRGLTVYRGSYYQPAGWEAQKAAGHETAVFSISGWTDDLFPPVESFRQFKYLKRLDPLWPVEVRVADIGHPRAQNKPATWQSLNREAWAFVQANIGGSHRGQTTVASMPTICPGQPAGTATVRATTPEGLAKGTLKVSYGGADLLTEASGALDPDSANTDAVLTNILHTDSCKTSRTDSWPGRYSGVSDALDQSVTYVGLGEVDVPYVLAGLTATLTARLWDVAPGGQERLVTRGAYRVDVSPLDSRHPDPPAGTLRLPFFGNHWALPAGHRLRLDLAQVDTPTFLPDKTPAALAIHDPQLLLPIREGDSSDLTGTQTST